MTKFIVYAWRDKDQEPYFVSKCRADSDARFKDKKNILAPSDPERIVILKEFEDEMASLDFLDRLTYELGFEADGSGTLQNSWISPYHLRVKNLYECRSNLDDHAISSQSDKRRRVTDKD